MTFNKFLISGIVGIGILAGSTGFAFAQTTYKVQPGDVFGTISQKYSITTSSLMKVNNANSSTVLYSGQILIIPTVHIVQSGDTYWTICKKYQVDFNKLLSVNSATEKSTLSIGNKVIIPAQTQIAEVSTYIVLKDDTYWTVSQKFKVNLDELLDLNGANEKTYLTVGQVIKVPKSSITTAPLPKPETQTKPYITYSNYIVQKNENTWSIADKFGITAAELMTANNINSNTVLNVGKQLKIPVHNIPVKSTPGEKYGELLDWWTEAQYLIPRGTSFEVVDLYTGKSFMAKRTGGTNHSDTETLTVSDTNKMKAIWGGNFSWTRRPVEIKVNGRKIAASMTAMPHAGSDSAPSGVWTSWRSNGYGAGINYDFIKGNGIDGHFDIHFLNSTRHKDGKLDSAHQANIKISSGIN